MRSSGWSRRAFKRSPMLVGLGLVLAIAAHAQQPAAVERGGSASGAGQPGHGNNANAAAGTRPQSAPSQPARRNDQASRRQADQQQVQQNGKTLQGGVRPPNPARGTERLPGPSAPTPRVQMPNTSQQPRYSRVVPPASRRSLEQRRPAGQSAAPRRPLSPQQRDNLRENRPVGQPQMREPAPHPASEPSPRVEPPRPQL